MSTKLIEETNLSQAWCSTLRHILESPGIEITPLLLTLTDFEETEQIKNNLNKSLIIKELDTIETVSETIFPESLYQYYDRSRTLLYKGYSNNLPRIKKLDTRNSRGTYFERLISYSSDDESINQLEIIISSINDNTPTRRSKLQASIFDPRKDHSKAKYQGFPCLQHVTFYITEEKGLVLNSFYALQYLYQRGYGNWLGLINLGKFIANETNLKFERFNCFVGVEKLDHLTKSEAKELLKDIEN